VTHFSHCRLFLGHDSGVSHLAAACGAPCVLLFGPTDPAVWAPPSPRVKVIGPVGDLNSLAVSGVRQAVAAALADPG
jgi:heptosyltransferase-2